ncbi:membrane protein insertase, YidC/Oxa1 family, C-terminal domain [Longilinea arvoryzae]|uniref:Membrane protein insertase, YidC/Oxa1 family, C-terminal domain n=1 Tax=Longilinea arvoryzae TaxID=360412 RepID=A0A0S7BJ60_9CHLR|nr:YidC/Oxa1 family membrane protein insertase [Longilinea arvoryzae]GAP15156.1 membrane protein insertase, YidC/Oxa1 family, C-terminal domain [Longilinea arvoryzae]
MWDALIITPFINALLFIYNLVGNFGIAIILFTILIRLVTHPLMARQIKGSKAMTTLQQDPRYVEIMTKYKDDKEKQAVEQQKLMKELGINPFSSCLPTLIQFPIIIGLYQAVIQAMAATPLEMMNLTRHIYPSLLKVSALIPLNSHFLWMELGQPERLNIPGIPFGIPILAVVVAASTYLQSKLMTPAQTANPSDPNNQAAMMTRMMNLYMPFLMGYMALTLASGLAVYFLVSNLIGIAQYALLGQLNIKNLLPGKKEEPPKMVSYKPVSKKPVTNKPKGKK